MNNPFRHKITILDRSEEHFSGKKDPWKDRVVYPRSVGIAYLVQVSIFLLLVWFRPDWIPFLLLIATLSMWGLSEATRSKYYKIGYYDGKQDYEETELRG